jgi:Flp pilus assembly protein TadD
MADQALKFIEEMHQQADVLGLDNRTNQNPLLMVETSAHLAKGDVAGAQSTIDTALAHSPGDEGLLGTATQVYMNYGRFTNAVTMLDRQLTITPDNPNALNQKGYACLQIGAFDQAIPTLTRLLTLQTNNYFAMLNRAIAYLRSDHLDDAQRDYETVQKVFPTAFQVDYGLAEIAYRRKDTNSAIQASERYLADVIENSKRTGASTNTSESQFIIARLKDLKAGAH